MFSQPSRGFGSTQDPWFKIGTFDVGSAALTSLAMLLGMLLVSVEGGTGAGPVNRALLYWPDRILDGQVWRLLTWFIPSEPGLWTLVSIVMIFLLGSRIEDMLGKVRMARFLVITMLVVSVLAIIFHAIGWQLRSLPEGYMLNSVVFYAFIAAMPGARFFFGIPGWVLGLVSFTIHLLQLIEFRSWADILYLFMWTGGVLMVTKAFGLADSVTWIPDVRPVTSKIGGRGDGTSGGAPGTAASRSARRAKAAKRDTPIVPVDSSFEEMGIDEILDQISAFGMDSLNAAQRKKLDAYSKGRRKDK